MYGAQEAFTPASLAEFLHAAKPEVLQPSPASRSIDIGTLAFSGPRNLGSPAETRLVSTFNPSIAAAPASLCARCAWVVTLRAESLHQCDASSPYLENGFGTVRRAANAWFRGTALAVLDAQLDLLGWTWLINSPTFQISDPPKPPSNGWSVRAGAADRFVPPWSKPVYDARLLNFDEQLLVTYNCMACDFSVSLLHLRADPTSDGGLVNLRAWTTQRFVDRAKTGWLRGRNQALFTTSDRNPSSAPDAPPPGVTPSSTTTAAAAAAAAATTTTTAMATKSKQPSELFVQSWLGVVGSLGSPAAIRRRLVRCYWNRTAAPAALDGVRLPQGFTTRDVSTAGREHCGPMPPGAMLEVSVIISDTQQRARQRHKLRRLQRRREEARLQHNLTLSDADSDAADSTASMHASAVDEDTLPPNPQITRLSPFASATLLANHTERLGAVLNTTNLKRRGVRVSLTAHLQRVLLRSPDGREVRDVLLGVGHMHRGAGRKLEQSLRAERVAERRRSAAGSGRLSRRTGGRRVDARRRARRLLQLRHDLLRFHKDQVQLPLLTPRRRKMMAPNASRASKKLKDEFGLPRRRSRLQFGYRYTHFFYVLQPGFPFGLLGTSHEFCLASLQDAQDCESVQFISGMALNNRAAANRTTLFGSVPGQQLPSTATATRIDEGVSSATDERAMGDAAEELLLAYGINDCEAKIASVPLRRVWSMLRWLPNSTWS